MKGLGLRTREVGLAESIEATARKINRSGIVVKVRASDFTQPLGRMSAKANEFTKSLEASNARVIAFGASAAIIGGVTTSFAQLVIQATKVEKILTDINIVLGTTSQNLAKFGDGLFKVARNTSQSLETAAEAALEFSRQGLSMEETLKRTNDALILTRLTSLKAADSVKGLTAAVNGFADAGLTTTQIINKLAAVDVKFAVSTDDLINALARAGAVAQDAGVSFDQLMGAVTAAQQITARGGAVIGNSFKTIFTRVQRSSTIDRLEELGIAVRNLQGNTLPAMSVLQNLADTYDTLGSATKAAVAEQVGGVFQINILKAAIKDLNNETSIYSKATQTSATATNQAQMKNAELQKTLSSIANQTLTTVRELTASLGELTIAPALKEFLQSANSLLSGISELFGDKEGETIGGEFAKGFARSLGSVLTGPGVMITVLVFAKLFGQAFKFAKDSIKDLLQIASIKDKERMIQESIVDAMIQNVDLSKQLIAYDKDQVKQEQLVLALLKEQTAHMEQQRAIAKSIAPALRREGVQPNLIVDTSRKGKAEGFVPNYNNQPTALEKLKERQGAAKGGYTAGPISTMNVSGLGRVVYNKNETVKKFDGMKQPAIMPPEQSRAGKKYKDKFSGTHGFDPYQGSQNNSTYDIGLVPNFAKLVGSTLEMDPAKLLFVGGGGSNKQERTEIEAALTDPKQLKYFTAALHEIVGYDKKGSLKSGARVMNPLSVLQHELGVSHIKRGFSMRKKPRLRGRPKDAADAMEEKVAGIEGQNQKHSSLSPKLRATRTGYRDKKTGKKKGMQNYPVDIISYGASWPTIEVKSGEFHPHNIISKSLRMSSDRELSNFIRKNTSRSDIADALDQSNFNSASSAAKSLNLFDPVSGKNVADRNFNIDSPDDRKFIDEWGLSKGLVPNFISQNAREAIKRLQSQGSTAGEKAAAASALNRANKSGKKRFDIKKSDGSKPSMYESMYVDSFIKGSGSKSDLSYLKSKGFSESLLLKARKSFQNDPQNTMINSSGGFVPNFIEDPNRQGREKEIRDTLQDGSMNQKYSSGLVPNFIRSGATSREFAKLSVALAKWSARNHPEPRLKLIGPDKLFSIPRRNADEANKNVQNIRQFISSSEYRALEAPELKKKITRFYNRTVARSSLDNPDRNFAKGDHTFEGRIAASNGLIPNFVQPSDIPAATITADGSIDSRDVFELRDGRMFKPTAKANQPDLASSGMNTLLPGQILTARGPEAQNIRLSSLASAKKASGNKWRDFTVVPGRTYEDQLVPYLGQAHPNLNIDYGQKGAIGYTNLAKFGSGTDSFMRRHKYADAYQGRTHGIGTIFNKLNAAGLLQRKLPQVKDAVEKNKNLDLTNLLGFAEISGSAPSDTVIRSRNKSIDPQQIPGYKAFIQNSVTSSSLRKRFLGDPKKPKKMGIEWDLDAFHVNSGGMHSGLIPNFADPLGEAITREKSALRQQGSSASVYVGQDNRLKDPQNPMGLLVANRRDEPVSGSQGVNRAIRNGMDPKAHGASIGFTPNFQFMSKNYAKGGQVQTNVPTSGMDDLGRSASDAAGKVKEHGKTSKDAALGGMDMMGAMFALTSVTYAVEGAMGDVESKAGQLVKTLNAAVMGASQGAMVFSAMNQMGDSFNAKGTKMGRLLGGAAKGLGIFGAAIGVAVPVFQSLKENTTLLDGPLDTLRKSAAKTSKSIESLGNAITAHQSVEETRKELSDLNNSASKNTFDGEIKRLSLHSRLIKAETELSNQTTELSKHVNLSAAEIELMTSGTAAGFKKLQEAMVQAQRSIAFNKMFEDFTTFTQGDDSLLASNREEAKNPLMAQQVETSMAKMTAFGFQSQDMDKTKIASAFDGLMSMVEAQVNKYDLDVRAQRPDATMGDRAAFASRAMGMSKEEKANRSFYQHGTESIAEKTITDQLVSNTDLPQELKTMAGMGMDAMNPTQLLKFLEKQKELVLKFNQGEEEKLKEQQVNYDYLRQTTRLRQRLRDNVVLQAKQSEIDLGHQKQIQGISSSQRDHVLKYNAALGNMTKASQISAELAEKSLKIDIDLVNKKQEINNKYQQEGQKFIQSLFANPKEQLLDPELLQAQGGKSADGKDLSDEDTFKKSRAQLAKKMSGVDMSSMEGSMQDAFQSLIEQVKENKKGLRIENPDRVKFLFEQFLSNLKTSEDQQAALNALQKGGVINKQKDLVSFFEKQKASKKQESDAAATSSELEKAALANVRERMQMEKSTLAYHTKRLNDLRATPHHQLDAVVSEQFKTNKAIADADIINLRAKQSYISHGQGLSELQDEQLSVEKQRILNEHVGISIQTERLNAEAKLRQNLMEYNDIIRQKVANEIKTFANKQEDDVVLLKQEKDQNFFEKEAEFNVGQSIRDEERARIKHAEALNKGTYYINALHGMAEAARNFEQTMIEQTAKLNKGEFAREGAREIGLKRVNMRGAVQKVTAQRDVYESEGNEVRAAEVNVEVQQAMKDLNKELNQGSLFLDSWRVKLAEANERIAKFSETLANTSFDAIRDGFRQMFTDITEGTKSTGDIALNFFGSIAKKIQDKLFDQAADQLTAGMMQLFGLQQYHTGGIVSRYSTGGKAKDVPAMLTAGEYVVRKKVVDKIGLNELNKINQTGSLEELYDKPNEPSDFELFNSGGMVQPPIIRMKEGGALNNYLKTNSEDGKSKNYFSEDVKHSIGNLSETINRFAGGLAFLRYGGQPTRQQNKDDSYAKIGAGAGMMAGTALGKMAFGKDESGDDGAPKAPTRPKALNTRSSLNIDPTSRQMSARYRASDDYSKEYGRYLLEKYDYDVQKENQKQMERAQQIGAIASTVTMMAGMSIGKKITEGPAPTVDDLDAKVEKDSKGFQKITRGNHNMNQYQRQAQYERAVNSAYNTTNVTQSQSFQRNQNSSSSIAGGFSDSYSYNDLTKQYYNQGGHVHSSVSTFNNGGSVVSPYSYFSRGGKVYGGNTTTSNNVSYMSAGGMVHGPGGIDKVGPVMLDRGEYVIKASSVNKVEKQYPGFFDRLNSVKMNEGGSVGEAAATTSNNTENITNENSSNSSNVTVNINVSSGGETTAEGGGASQQEFASKIKDAVVGVIAQEKRVGGMLRGN